MTKQTKNIKSQQKQEKLDRLSKALKDNLRRRKAQAKKTNNNEVEEK